MGVKEEKGEDEEEEEEKDEESLYSPHPETACSLKVAANTEVLTAGVTDFKPTSGALYH